MATSDERRALLSVRCPWCNAMAGDECYVAVPSGIPSAARRRIPRRRITTLDGGCHDARWQAALGRGAKVLA